MSSIVVVKSKLHHYFLFLEIQSVALTNISYISNIQIFLQTFGVLYANYKQILLQLVFFLIVFV